MFVSVSLECHCDEAVARYAAMACYGCRSNVSNGFEFVGVSTWTSGRLLYSPIIEFRVPAARRSASNYAQRGVSFRLFQGVPNPGAKLSYTNLAVPFVGLSSP